MFGPQKYGMHGSKEDALPGPCDPWQLCSVASGDVHCADPSNRRNTPSVGGVKQLPVKGQTGAVRQHKTTRLPAGDIFFFPLTFPSASGVGRSLAQPRVLVSFKEATLFSPL